MSVVELGSKVGLGTAPLGSYEGGPLWWGPQDRGESVRTIRTALDAGIRWIDTSPFYGWGLAEELVAEALAGVPAADRPLVLTKCGTFPPDNRTDASPAAIGAEVEGSLRRLRVDRLDVVQIHDEDPAVPIEESWGALMDLIAEGLVGAAGLSNHAPALMDRALAVGPVAVVQHQYSLLDRTPERDGVLEWCDRHDVPFLAWSPLASGYLGDGFDLAALHETDLRRRLRWNRPEHRDETARIQTALANVARDTGSTMAAVAVAWVCRGARRHAIVGARTPGEALVAATTPSLGDELLASLG